MIWAARDDTEDDDDDEDGLDLDDEEEEVLRFDLAVDILLLGRLDFPDGGELDFPFPPVPRLATCSAMFCRWWYRKCPGATGWKASVVQHDTSTSISGRRVAIVVLILDTDSSGW